jgi:hypothetical protein
MRFTDLFVLMVIRHKVMTMTEFYNADYFDIDLVASHLEEVERDALERMRMMMWATLAPYSKKHQSPEEIIKFSWESGKEGNAAPTTKEQFEQVFKNFKKAE